LASVYSAWRKRNGLNLGLLTGDPRFASPAELAGDSPSAESDRYSLAVLLLASISVANNPDSGQLFWKQFEYQGKGLIDRIGVPAELWMKCLNDNSGKPIVELGEATRSRLIQALSGEEKPKSERPRRQTGGPPSIGSGSQETINLQRDSNPGNNGPSGSLRDDFQEVIDAVEKLRKGNWNPVLMALCLLAGLSIGYFISEQTQPDNAGNEAVLKAIGDVNTRLESSSKALKSVTCEGSHLTVVGDKCMIDRRLGFCPDNSFADPATRRCPKPVGTTHQAQTVKPGASCKRVEVLVTFKKSGKDYTFGKSDLNAIKTHLKKCEPSKLVRYIFHHAAGDNEAALDKRIGSRRKILRKQMDDAGIEIQADSISVEKKVTVRDGGSEGDFGHKLVVSCCQKV